MAFLDKLRGITPTERLARDAVEWFAAHGVPNATLDATRTEIRFVDAASSTQIVSLRNLQLDCKQSPPAQRGSVIDRFLNGILQSRQPGPTTFDQARPMLMPVVRNAWDLGVASLSMRRMDAMTSQHVVSAPWTADVAVALVIDRPDSMRYVTDALLQQWDVSFETAHAAAIENLRALPEVDGWTLLAPGVWLGRWGDDYDSSRILLPDLIHRLGVPEPVAVVPFRDAVLVASAKDPEAVSRVATLVAEGAATTNRWVSFTPFRLMDSAWSEHSVQDPAAAQTFARLRKRQLAEAYAAQKNLYEEIHKVMGDDLFVASHTLVEAADGTWFSYAVWTAGVDTLLPEAESLILQRQGEDASRIRLPWTAAVQAFADCMVRTDDVPARWRLRRFPTAVQLASVSDAAIT